MKEIMVQIGKIYFIETELFNHLFALRIKVPFINFPIFFVIF